MSYEGYVINLCPNGHIITSPCTYEQDGLEKCRCGAKLIVHRAVDETNGYPVQIGYEVIELQAEKRETCPQCGHSKQVEPGKYKIENVEVYWWDGNTTYPTTKDAVKDPYI